MVLSFIAIIVVALFVGEILTLRMEESTTKEIISYKDTVESFFRGFISKLVDRELT